MAGDHDRNMLHMRIDPVEDGVRLEAGMTVWLSR
jgi:hypothetical protein